ncbi:pyruvate ferredoxin/flavodoxin oxidoreductase, beta subunit [Alkaliphilus metalliredigens QYMF]|uniref:Pyruvate ferredoxin/flavodoxin oxidoreductase, beta subunit n=1 Tax=Alkaliphilus metalliredigens (strain QYMF) TaxID=293826 RepID=A6TMI8_ALKMQ|nr:2-oxoacid:ferredoxin oxidoreductase subunit beta [Alkaliphilus metalliredigens]ABR47406.1 pyruvate ferredoxin/flavodoxin oxidoreductase, beta subunit [Alkaliphilus metalliredigens QYMF]
MTSSMKEYSNQVSPTWCPGCGHFSILRALQVTASNLSIPFENFAVITGIGCSGRLSGYLNCYGFHGIHGRSLPIAQGIKMANKNLVVIAAGGDGDGFAIGANHTLHAIRRNINMTYIVLNNQVYGLTKGHTSPLSDEGFQTKSTPRGSIHAPLKPGITAMSAGASFLAQGFSAFPDQLVELITKAIAHDGFSLVNVFSPCVTFNKNNTYQWYRENLVNLDDHDHYDPSQYQGAMDQLIETDGLCTGIIYQQNRPSYQERLQSEDALPLVDLDLTISKDEFEKLMEGFK